MFVGFCLPQRLAAGRRAYAEGAETDGDGSGPMHLEQLVVGRLRLELAGRFDGGLEVGAGHGGVGVETPWALFERIAVKRVSVSATQVDVEGRVQSKDGALI